MAAKSCSSSARWWKCGAGLTMPREHVVVGVDVQPAGAVADPVRDAEPEHLGVEVDPAPHVGHEEVDVLHPARVVRGRSAAVLGLVRPPVGRRDVLDEVDDVALGVAELQRARTVARPVDARGQRRRVRAAPSRPRPASDRRRARRRCGRGPAPRRSRSARGRSPRRCSEAARVPASSATRREAVQPCPALARLGGVARAQRDVVQPSHADHAPASPNVPWRSHTVFRSQ